MKIKQTRTAASVDLLAAAKALLTKIEGMTSQEFSMGGEKLEREALSAAIARAEGGK